MCPALPVPPSSFRTRSLTEVRARQATGKSQLPLCWACVLPCLASVLGIQTQVLLTAQRVFSPLSQLPSPTRTSLYSLSLVASTANTGRIFPSCCLQVLGCAHYTFDWMVYTKLHYLCWNISRLEEQDTDREGEWLWSRLSLEGDRPEHWGVARSTDLLSDCLDLQLISFCIPGVLLWTSYITFLCRFPPP